MRREVGQLWGPEQRILGPFLVVPYTVRIETVQGEKRIEQIQERRAVFTPEALEVTGRADAKTLRRSIFEVPVYAARLKLSGRFAAPRIGRRCRRGGGGALARCRVRARAVGRLRAQGGGGPRDRRRRPPLPFAPSVGFPSTHLSGIHAKLAGAGSALLPDPEQPPQPFAFTVDLTFNGSVSLSVAPVARETRVSLSSDWPHPSFSGAFLPDERQVTSSGFTAAWKIPHLARSVPEAWSLAETGLERLQPYAFGVTMIDPVDFYSLVNRAAKYGIMFVALAFMAVFCLELVSARRVHPVQYLFTGISLVFFYVLLLSLAEHLGFTRAYLAASAATGAMLALYVGAAMSSAIEGAGHARGLCRDLRHALPDPAARGLRACSPARSLGFVALAIVMFVTLRVDWSGGSAREVRVSIRSLPAATWGASVQGIDPHREPKLSMLRRFLHFPASQWCRGVMLAQD